MRADLGCFPPCAKELWKPYSVHFPECVAHPPPPTHWATLPCLFSSADYKAHFRIFKGTCGCFKATPRERKCWDIKAHSWSMTCSHMSSIWELLEEWSSIVWLLDVFHLQRVYLWFHSSTVEFLYCGFIPLLSFSFGFIPIWVWAGAVARDSQIRIPHITRWEPKPPPRTRFCKARSIY